MRLQVDESQACKFLEALAPGEQVFVFQTIDDDKTRKLPALSRILTGALSEVIHTLEYLQNQGAGVFVQIQGGHARGQQAITHGRTVVVDADDPDDNSTVIAQLKSEMPAPSAMIQSSPGKFHFYWFLQDADAEATRDLTREVADVAGTDPSVASPERVMRLPGTWHQKSGTPTQVKLMGQIRPQRHEISDLLGRVATATRRGARLVTGAGGQVQKRYDDVFGLPVSESEDMTVLPSGGRTQKLVSYIGKLVGEGYSAQWIEQEVRRIAAEGLPEGDTPISEASWQTEILPAIYRFQSRMETPPVAPTPAPRPAVSVPGLPEAPGSVPPPPPPAATEGQAVPPPPPAMQAPQISSEEPVTDRPNVNLAMEEWIERFVWIEQGQFVVDTTKPLASGKYSAADFEKSKKNHKVDNASTYSKWLSNSFRRTMRDFIFAPGSGRVVQRDKALYYNTFEPPAPLVEVFDPDRIGLFLDHMVYLFEDADAWWRMMNWFVFTVAQPQVRIPWAPLLISGEGRGKTWIAECVKAMFDGKYTSAVETKDLESPYNSYMADVILVAFEEVHTRNKHETLDKFKTLITNQTLEINEKFGGKGQREIYANTFMTSNHDDALALQAGKESRRYWIYKIDKPAFDGKFLYQWLETTGPKHLMHWCLGVDQSDWAFNEWPEYTTAKDVMIKANMSLVTRALVECIDDRVGVFQVDMGDERQIEDTVAMWLDQDRLDKRQKGELKHLLRQYCEPLRRIRIGSKYVRLVVWRHNTNWMMADDGILAREYERSKRAALGQDPGSPLAAAGG